MVAAKCRTLLEPISEISRPFKTLEVDETIIMDTACWMFLAPVRPRLRKTGDPHKSRFDLTQVQLLRAFRDAGLISRLEPAPCLYQVEHSGASVDFAKGARTLITIES